MGSGFRCGSGRRGPDLVLFIGWDRSVVFNDADDGC